MFVFLFEHSKLKSICIRKFKCTGKADYSFLPSDKECIVHMHIVIVFLVINALKCK